MVTGAPLALTMLSTASAVLREERKTEVEESVSQVSYQGKNFHSAGKCGWNHFHKPILAILVGGLLFGTGTAFSLIYFTQVGNVSYLVGPVCLSIGLMFLVTGLVWVPVIKQELVHAAMTQMNYGRSPLPDHGICAQACVTIS